MSSLPYTERSTSMLDLVRRTCHDGKLEDLDPTGEEVYIPDEWWGKADQSYDGEYRYVNLSPTKLSRMLEAGDLPESERPAVELAMSFWRAKSPGGCEAGYVDRGEPKQAHVVTNLRECIASNGRDSQVFSRGLLSFDTPQTPLQGEGGRFLALDIIDYDLLQAREQQEGPVQDKGDWY